MRRILLLCILLISSGLIAPSQTFASYEEARQEYLINFDLYRQKYTEFQIAKNEYKKFNTLISQTAALEKTKEMLRQRDLLFRSYLLTLYEKVNDPDAGLQNTTRQQYLTLLGNEIIFLETHSLRLPSVGSIDDAVDVSKEFESHHMVLQTTVRQILIGLSLGQLAIAANHFDDVLTYANDIVAANQAMINFGQQETIKRWLLQIDSKRNYYRQKYDQLTISNAQLSARNADDLDRKYNELVRGAGEARQYLVEAVSFVSEVRDALKYSQ